MSHTESEASRSGANFYGANGKGIPNLGNQMVRAQNNKGDQVELQFNVANISRPLASVHEICERGHSVVLKKDSGYIQSDATGRKTELRVEGKLYFLDLWVQIPKKLAEASPFARRT